MLLRSVSHDLRNPLNSILGATTELFDGADYDEPTRKRLLGLVIDETRRLDRIVDNLLGLSRLQAGALDPTREPMSVTEVVEQCESRFGLIGGAGDRLEVDRAAAGRRCRRRPGADRPGADEPRGERGASRVDRTCVSRSAPW